MWLKGFCTKQGTLLNNGSMTTFPEFVFYLCLKKDTDNKK